MSCFKAKSAVLFAREVRCFRISGCEIPVKYRNLPLFSPRFALKTVVFSLSSPCFQCLHFRRRAIRFCLPWLFLMQVMSSEFDVFSLASHSVPALCYLFFACVFPAFHAYAVTFIYLFVPLHIRGTKRKSSVKNA